MDGEYYCRLAKAGYRFRFLPATVAAFTFHDLNVMVLNRGIQSVEWLRIRRGIVPVSSWIRPFERIVYGAVSLVAHQWRRILVVFRLLFQTNDHGK
jgi:hypothetical protein